MSGIGSSSGSREPRGKDETAAKDSASSSSSRPASARPSPSSSSSPLNAYLLAPSFSASASASVAAASGAGDGSGSSALSTEMLDWLEQLLGGALERPAPGAAPAGTFPFLHRSLSRPHSSGGPQLPSPVPRERFLLLALKAKCFPLSVVAYVYFTCAAMYTRMRGDGILSLQHETERLN